MAKQKRKPKPMSRAGKRKALLHMTTEIFGKDLLTKHLSENKDLLRVIETIDSRYSNFVEASVKKAVEEYIGYKMEDQNQLLAYMEENCTVLRSDEANPMNILYAHKGTPNEIELACWRDKPDAVKRMAGIKDLDGE